MHKTLKDLQKLEIIFQSRLKEKTTYDMPISNEIIELIRLSRSLLQKYGYTLIEVFNICGREHLPHDLRLTRIFETVEEILKETENA
jgi:hypothetical protein